MKRKSSFGNLLDVTIGIEVRAGVLPRCEHGICDLAPGIGFNWDNAFGAFQRFDLMNCTVEVVMRRIVDAR